ncbi:DUF927 domain-containing protein [Nitratidesulfovibrio vulgaris]|uniref:DUF927 domain-containing protein n=1 Tax=Nitratidesulfovibrio vulgaris TaxID=881 RepID=UPI0013E0B43C|nr:DUF927 domain-containing protein [Nitratidesulfovibrio vulgaris]
MTPPPSEANLIAAFAAKLEDAGLLPGAVIADDEMHRCPTADKPHSEDGSYLAHCDRPPNITWWNWRTGEKGTWCAVDAADLTPADRTRLAERKATCEAKLAAQYEHAAQEAQRIWDSAKEASDGHEYLQRKEVKAYGLRLGGDELLVPLRDATGALRTLQGIGPDGFKRLLTGGRKAGSFFTIPAKDGSTSGPLLIAEGYATAASLHAATGLETVMAVDAHNLLSVAKALRGMWPGREIVLCADNDCALKDGSPRGNNVGLEAAEAAASPIGGTVALCPAHEGRAADFNDLHVARGLEAVRAVVEKALEASMCPMPEGFRMIPDGPRAGLYRIKTTPDGDEQEVRLGAPLHVLGQVRDAAADDWGLMLEWHDPDGNRHRWAMPTMMTRRYQGEWLQRLMAGGWKPDPHAAEKDIARFLEAASPPKRFRCVPRVGWHGESFVLPDRTFRAEGTAGPPEETVLQTAAPVAAYSIGGAFEEWLRAARLAAGNRRTEFFLAAAFAGPLLGLLDGEGGGFHLHSDSSDGKTTSQRLAASVWGHPDAYKVTWRLTDNGLEGIAVGTNDTLLVLDEMGQASSEVVASATYMISNGAGKTRATRDGGVRRPASWRVLFLSSGEYSLKHHLEAGKVRMAAGMAVRLADIPANAGVGHGTFEELHGLADGKSLADAMASIITQHHGHAGPRFLEWLVAHQAELRHEVPGQIEEIARRFAPPEACGQVLRVASRFALVALAGMLAQEAEALPPEVDPLGAAGACFAAWLDARGTAGPSEDAAILEAVRGFIETHGASRFQDLAQPDTVCYHRAGFRDSDAQEYVFLAQGLSEAAGGVKADRAARVLDAAGWIRREGGRNQARRSLPGLGRVRCYVVQLPQDATDTDQACGAARPARMMQ